MHSTIARGVDQQPQDRPAGAGPGVRPLDRPVAATAIAGIVAATWHLVWVARHRDVGGFGVDESGYLASAFHLHGELQHGGLSALLDAVLATPRSGPLVPLLSALFLEVFGRNVTAAFAAQAVLYVVTAVAIAAIVARLSNRAAALVAGFVALGMPTAVITARTYQLGSAVNAFLALSVLALVCSDRGHRRGPMLGFGLAVGAMLLSRTMPIGFLPGLVAAVAWYVERTRRTVANLVLATVAMLAVAGPWWVAQWDGIVAYLFSFGYGSGARMIPEVPLALRLPVRLGLVTVDVRLLLLAPAVAVAVAAIGAWRRRPAGVGWRHVARRERGLVSIILVVGGGAIALLSSSNNGTFFQSPLEVLSVAAFAVVASRLRSPLVRAAGVAATVIAVVNVVAISTWTPGSTRPVADGTSWSVVMFGGTEEAQSQDFSADDPRFATSASWDARSRAERDWWLATRSVLRAVDEVADGSPTIMSIVGERTILNANTLLLHGELTGRTVNVESTATPEAMMSGDVDLSPMSGPYRRVIVSVIPRDRAQTQGVDVESTLREAERQGWRLARTVELPRGARVELRIFTSPSGR